MRGIPGGRDRLRLGAVALGLALVFLGALQYRWLREVADAQRSRMRADAAARATAIGQDFDREITRAFLMLPVDTQSVASRDASTYARRFEEFRRASRWPGLVRDVFVREAAPGSGLLRFSPEEERLVPAEWPASLASVRATLERVPGAAPLPSVFTEGPALVVPVTEPFTAALAFPTESPRSPSALHRMLIRRTHAGSPGPCTILLLDRDVLTTRMLPDILSSRMSGDDGGEYEASVVDARSGATVYGTAGAGDGDAGGDFFRLRLDELDAAILKSFVPDVLRRNVGERVSVRVVESVSEGTPPGRWRLRLRHERGSVEQAVQAALFRNLAIAFSVLAVLGGGVALMAISARRERDLAARQLEFVAAVSHELRTPLAVIRSAGDNLADGVVSEAAQVKRYGGLVRDEGLRLSEMVEQVLGFAGAQALGPGREPVEAAAIVERARAAESRPGFVVECDVAAGLPPLLGDARALERAVANLLSNARKYGGPEPRAVLRVRGMPPDAPKEVAITVSDGGPGIEADERSLLFEPFFRGRRAREAQAPGSGLGLAIVRRIVLGHGGRVEAAPGPDGGAVFTIVLPAGPAAPVRAASDVQAHPAR